MIKSICAMETMDPREIPAWLQQHYDLPAPFEVSLLRSYTHAVYQVITPREQFVLKVYGQSWRSAEEIKYEVDLLEFLARQGLAIAKPIRGRNSAGVKPVSSAQGEQFAVLFEFAAGAKPEPPFSDHLYFRFGQAIGRMHEFSKNFTSGYPRQNIDLQYLIDQPLQVVLPLLKRRLNAVLYLARLGDWLKNKLMALSQQGLDWGPIHGDASLDNLHVVNAEEIILYDFDSGGPGWRASDLQGWAVGLPEYQQRYSAFLHGYRQVRPLHAQDIEASRYLTLAWDIWGLKIDLERRVRTLGQDAIDAYLSVQIARLREREKSLNSIAAD
jgi:Ser/Thr protein kinase RdoA (MazF antagonist)